MTRHEWPRRRQQGSLAGIPGRTGAHPCRPAERLAGIRSFTEKVDDIREIPLGEFLGVSLILCEVEYAEERADKG